MSQRTRSLSSRFNLKCALLAALLCFGVREGWSAADVTVTKAASPSPVLAGGTVHYTVTVQNSASPTKALTGVQMTDTIDGQSALVAGSVHASPLAFNDTYTVIGNTRLFVGQSALAGEPNVTIGGAGVLTSALLANDVAITDSIVLNTVTNAATTQGGAITLFADGSFVYTPKAGFTGTDTFDYTIKNSVDNTLTDTGTITFNITNMVWYVNSAAGTNGDGRANSPFNILSGAQTASAIGDFIYLFASATNYTGGITLKNTQQLIGGGSALVVASKTLINAGTRPVMSGAGVVLALGNTLSGFNMSNTGSGASIAGASVGTLAVNTMLINTTGAGLDLTGVSTPSVNISLDSVASSGGTKNVNLVGLNGTVALGSGALSGASNNALDVSGGAAAITFSGTIGNTTAHSVNVASMTSPGTVSLSGQVSGSGSGINLTSNGGGTGAVISFTGGISLSTGGNLAFTATGGGIVNATQNNGTIVNTLATTTATALTVTSTTIGASGLTFRSINANGGANGIVLTTTGSTGTFTVVGDGASDPANTTRGNTTAKNGGGTITLGAGGTIQNTTGSGIILTSTGPVSLTSMNITNAGGATVNSGNNGITATTGNGLTLDNVKITGSTGNSGLRGTLSNLVLQHTDIDGNGTATGADANDNWNVRLDNLSGTSTVSNSLFFNSLEDIFTITNTGGTLNLTLTNCEFRDTSFTGAGDAGFQMIASGAASTTLTATGCTFKNVKTTGFHYAGNGTSGGTVKIQNSQFGGTAAGGDAANQNGVDIDIDHQGASATLNFEVSGNTTRQGFRANDSSSINIFLGGLSTSGTLMSGTVKNNIVGTTGVANSGSDLGAGIGIDCSGAGQMIASVTGNSVNQVKALSANVFDASTAGTTTLKLFVHNNTFNGNPAQANPQYGLHVNSGTGTPGENISVCLDMGGNSVTMPASAIASVALDSFPTTNTLLVGYVGAANNASQIQSFLATANTTATPTPLYTAAGGSTFAGVCGITFPTLLFAEGGVSGNSSPNPSHCDCWGHDKVAPASAAKSATPNEFGLHSVALAPVLSSKPVPSTQTVAESVLLFGMP